MRNHLQDLNEKHGNEARIVLFQLAALLADRFLFWPRANASLAKTTVNVVYMLATHLVAFEAARYLNRPKVQEKQETAKKDNKEAQTTIEPILGFRQFLPV